MVVTRTSAGRASGLAALAVLAAVSASPTQAASHRITWASEISRVWVTSKAGFIMCRSRGTAEAMVECPKFRPIGETRVVPMVGPMVYIVLTTNSEFFKGEYYVELPQTHPCRLPVPPKEGETRRKAVKSIGCPQ